MLAFGFLVSLQHKLYHSGYFYPRIARFDLPKDQHQRRQLQQDAFVLRPVRVKIGNAQHAAIRVPKKDTMIALYIAVEANAKGGTMYEAAGISNVHPAIGVPSG